MAGGTKDIFSRIRVHENQRLVDFVAGRTISLGHILGMWLMALQALRDNAVGVGVTEVTGKGRVLAGTGNHRLLGAGVAGDTNRLLFACDADFQRLMRIVAAETVLHLVMLTALMTVTATGDIVLHTRAMTLVTCLAIDFRFMRRTIRVDLRWLFVVAFDTV